MAQVTRETCRLIIEYFQRLEQFPLTSWEQAQLAYAWLEREDRRDAEEGDRAGGAAEREGK
jgi:hypothetical protein